MRPLKGPLYDEEYFDLESRYWSSANNTFSLGRTCARPSSLHSPHARHSYSARQSSTASGHVIPDVIRRTSRKGGSKANPELKKKKL